MRYDVETQYRDASNLNARINLHSRFSTHPVGWMHWAFDQMHLAPRQRILEVGAGPGTLWQQNLERVPEGCEITLTDFSAGMVEQARDNLQGCHLDISIRRANAEDLPFEDSGFDVVLANYMLYHVPDIPKALSEFRRVLRPDGSFFAATNGRNHMKEITDLVRRFDPQNPYDTGDLSARFGLENGAKQLAPFFEEVRLHLYEDSLYVTEPEPLVAYVASMMTVGAELTGERLDEFRRFVCGEFEAKGPVRIQKAQGIFEGTRA
jgi:SAM-dependent methyltransferase